jgi:adhesin transport system outer membrane protein
MMRRRFEAQVGSRNDITTVTARLLQAQNDLTQAKMQEQKARASLQELTGQPIEKIKPETVVSPLNGKNADALQTEALDASSEYAAAKAQLEVAQKMSDQKKASILPVLVARLEGLRYQSIGNPTVSYGQGYLALEGTFGNGLSQISEVRGQVAKVEGAEQQIEVTRRSTLQALESAVADSKSYTEQLKSVGEVVNQNQMIVESYLRLYLAGKKTWFEVLSAERELTQSRLSMADMKAAASSANNKVLRLLGKLFYLPIESQ